MTKLSDWIHERSITPGQLRRMLGVRTRSTISRWLTGQRVPNGAMLAKIERLTEGAVTKVDFLDPAPPQCARVVQRPDGSTRWVFPWSGEDEETTNYSSRLSRPLLRAIEVLDGRAWYSPRGVFLLDGRLSDPRRVVAAANDVLRARHQATIKYPFVEPIDE